MEIEGIGKFTHSVVDSLKREWPRGVEALAAGSVRASRTA
jgi:hypothetical protein